MTPLKGSHIQWAHCAISGKMHTTSNSVTGLLMTEIRATPNTAAHSWWKSCGFNWIVRDPAIIKNHSGTQSVYVKRSPESTSKKQAMLVIRFPFHPISVTSIETATTRIPHTNVSSPKSFITSGCLAFWQRIWNHLKSRTVANNSLSSRYFLLFFIQLLTSSCKQVPNFNQQKEMDVSQSWGSKNPRIFCKTIWGPLFFETHQS